MIQNTAADVIGTLYTRRVLGAAIERAGSDAQVRDYLNFYCAATCQPGIDAPVKRSYVYVHSKARPFSNAALRGGDEAKLQYSSPYCGRRDIYSNVPAIRLPNDGSDPEPAGVAYQSCHAQCLFLACSSALVGRQMAVFDDEYVLLGSANVNQRSLDGSRDTEIMVGGYQPFHSCASPHDGGEPQGESKVINSSRANQLQLHRQHHPVTHGIAQPGGYLDITSLWILLPWVW